MKKNTTILCAIMLMGSTSLNAITPNRLMSRGLPAYTSHGVNTYITDGDLTNWKQCTDNDIAIEIGQGSSRLFLTWESYGDCAWATNFTSNCTHYGTPLSDFKILTSANSTNGQDGEWTLATEVKNNIVMSRGVFVDFDGMSWIRIVSDKEVGQLLEIEAFDASSGADDTWFFMGTSISQMGLKQQSTDTTTADLINARFPSFTPAMLRGGIGCINSTEVVNHLHDYLEYAGNVKHWAIEMGTNDAWGGGDWNVETFRKNMQSIIDIAKEHNIEPIIARIIATDEKKAGWQVNKKFLDVIDELTESNGLRQGPDFFNYFLNHPEQLASDGVHPNETTLGGQTMHHLWAEALAPIYAESGPTEEGETGNAVVKTFLPAIEVAGTDIILSNPNMDVNVEIISSSGLLTTSFTVPQGTQNVLPTNLSSGTYVISLKWGGGVMSRKVIIR